MKENSTKTFKKTLSRLMAIQAFYQHKFYQGKEKIDNIIDNVVDNYSLDQDSEIKSYRSKVDVEFIKKLALGILPFVDEIDEDIKSFLRKDYSLEKLPEMILITLRFACFELKSFVDIPKNAIISEYVGIAASFHEKKKISFVNSILENLAKKYRSEEL